MQVHSVISAVSFGQKNDKKQTLTFPTAVVGTIGGAFYANQSKIKLNKDNFEQSVAIIDEKLDKDFNLEERFSALKKAINKQKEMDKKHLEKLGISSESTDFDVNELLKKHVNNPEKTIEGLKHDIKWAQGEVTNLEGSELVLKQQEIAEKIFIKNLAESAVDGKVNIKDFLIKQIQEENVIKSEMRDFSYIVDVFNRKRLGLFSVIGLVAGGILGYMIKINKKD